MPKYDDSKHKISIYKDTKFIVEQFYQALISKGFIAEVKSTDANTEDQFKIINPTFDARLLPGSPYKRAGTKHKVARGVENLFNMDIGGNAVEIGSISFELDRDIYDIYIEYTNAWVLVLQKINTGSLLTKNINHQQIVRTKVNDTHVLAKTLILRLVLFTLSEESLIRLDHEKYFEAIEDFIDRITGEGTPFKNANLYDHLGEFLRNQHKNFMACFRQSIGCRSALHSHKKAVINIEDFILAIEKVIKKQIIAYWDPQQNGFSLHEQTFNSVLSIMQLNAQQKLEDNKELVRYTGNKTISSDVISYFKDINSKYIHAATIVELYTVLEEVKDLELLIKSVKSLIESTGWLSFLGGFVHLTNLAKYIETFYDKAALILDTSKRSPRLKAKAPAYTGLLEHDAANLAKYSQIPSILLQSTQKLEDKKLHDMIYRKIEQDLKIICIVQKKLNIQLIDDSISEGLIAQLYPSIEGEMLKPQQKDKIEVSIAKKNSKSSKKSKKVLKESSFAEASPSYSWDTPASNVIESASVPLLEQETPVNGHEKELENIRALFPSVLAALIKDDTAAVCALITEVIGNHPETIQLKFSYALNVMRDDNGNSLLHLMIEKQCHKQCAWLISQSASVLIENISLLTPLELVAQNILRDKNNQSDIKLFFSMCDRAQLETKPDIVSLEAYRILSILSDTTVSEMQQALNKYQVEQKGRFDGTFWWAKRAIWDLFGQDCTVQRSVEVAKIYLVLLQLKDEQNYKALSKKLIDLISNSKNSNGSMLHQLIKLTLEKIEDVVSRNEVAFLQELKKYQESRQPRCSANSITVLSARLTRQQEEHKAETSAQDKTNAEQDKTNAEQDKTNAELKKKNTELEKDVKQMKALLSSLQKKGFFAQLEDETVSNEIEMESLEAPNCSTGMN